MMRQQPRRLAVMILDRIDASGAFAEPLLDRALSRWRDGDPRDRALVTELVYGTLRMRGFLDWVLGQFLRQDLAPAETSLRNILRAALYQIFYTERIPPYAVVNEAVALARALRPGREALVNAVLRGVLRRRDRLPYPERHEDLPGYIAVLHSHPLWLVERWLRQWGPEETLALCRANNTVPEAVLRVNRLQTSGEKVIEALAREGVVAEKARYAPEGLVVRSAGKLLRDTLPYRRGDFQVQDEASQLIARLLHPAGGETVLDLCAGIGGKATHLAELTGNRGRIVAVDRLASKIKQLHGLAARLGISAISAIVADATRPLRDIPPGSCDRVLLDAPCSGLGTLRRCPEIKWRLTTAGLARHAALQKILLARASECVKPGGRLVYSTCSVMAEENEDVVRAFLEERRDFRGIPAEAPAAELVDNDGCLRTFPHRHGVDGFFGAVLEKKTGTE